MLTMRSRRAPRLFVSVSKYSSHYLINIEH
jgi:hypothetical protein